MKLWQLFIFGSLGSCLGQGREESIEVSPDPDVEVEVPTEEPDELQEDCAQCPVRLLEVVSKEDDPDAAATLQLNDAGLKFLESQRSPLFLVPALGVYRGGKSLLLNRLMQRRAPYSNSFGVGHGQQTFTRGIEICAEALPDRAGTVVWMDTEGLFSSEDARSAYGPKIFSLALLFSSVVLFNNLKVLNQQFFLFFEEEQQQVARILREGLRSEGMRSDLLLPENLSIVWVLNQPHSLATSSEASQVQLDSFLTIQDKARERIKDSFTHLIHEVPSATHYQPQWSKLDQLPEEELLPEYVSAIQSLRQLLFTQLQGARPLQAASVAAQLRMYVDLVQKDHFSISLAKEAFEDSHVAQLCEKFGVLAQEFAGDLPSLNLSAAMDLSEQSIQEQRDLIIKDFHLGDGFLRRLQQCFRKKRDELEDINQEMVLAEWQKEVHSVAESGRCFILSKLAIELPKYRKTYGAIFSKSVEAKARDFALQVQRSRVAGCVLLRHFAVPVAPWFAWPVMALYIRQGALSGILTMAVHGVVLAGIYSILQFMGRLPFYVDLDYQVLKHHPGLLEFVMKYPQIPWDLLSQFIAILGWIRVAWIVASQIFRPPETRTIGQLSNLEIKLNTILERTEAQMKKEIITAALEAALWIDSNDPSAAALALVKGLVVVSQVGASDVHFGYLFEVEHRNMAKTAVKNFQFPDKEDSERCAASLKKESGKLRRCATSHDWDELIPGMVEALQKLSGAKDRKEGTKADGRAARKLFQDADDESDLEEVPGSSCCGCCFRGCIILMMVLGGIVGAAWVLEFSSRAGLLPTESK